MGGLIDQMETGYERERGPGPVLAVFMTIVVVITSWVIGYQLDDCFLEDCNFTEGLSTGLFLPAWAANEMNFTSASGFVGTATFFGWLVLAVLSARWERRRPRPSRVIWLLEFASAVLILWAVGSLALYYFGNYLL